MAKEENGVISTGETMGITAMIPDATLGQLFEEAEQRWGEIWDVNATRMRILMLCPRKDRKMMELHGDLVEHGQPIVSMFHRPREQAQLLEEQGLNPRDASFQFVDLATTDLGPWVQHLIKNEGWKRSSIVVRPLPFSIDSPAQRAFEVEQIMCFTHPDIAPINEYFLPFPTSSLPGKAFVSLPRRQAAEFARQQAEVLGVGRLERPAPQVVEQPVVEVAIEQPIVEEVVEPEVIESQPEEHEAEVEEVEHVPLPPSETTAEVEDVPLPAQHADDSEPTAPEESVQSEEPDVEEVAIEEEPLEDAEPQSEVEIEFRAFIQEKMDAGAEVSEFMDDPRWEELNERAIANQLDTWSILVDMTSIG
jgi:hypothetical protein